MEFKNIKEYLECYLISDITLLADVFNNFRKIIFDNLGLHCVKYISAPSLTKDCALIYSECKIENIKDVSIFQFVRKSIMGGLSDSINPYVKLDNEDETIANNDISSQYPYELSKKLPYKDYKFVEKLGGSNPILAHGKMCVFPFFPMGKNGKKSIWKEREKNSFPSLSIYFFPHFSPWGKWGKKVYGKKGKSIHFHILFSPFFPMGKNGKTHIFPWAKMELEPLPQNLMKIDMDKIKIMIALCYAM